MPYVALIEFFVSGTCFCSVFKLTFYFALFFFPKKNFNKNVCRCKEKKKPPEAPCFMWDPSSSSSWKMDFQITSCQVFFFFSGVKWSMCLIFFGRGYVGDCCSHSPLPGGDTWTGEQHFIRYLFLFFIWLKPLLAPHPRPLSLIVLPPAERKTSIRMPGTHSAVPFL